MDGADDAVRTSPLPIGLHRWQMEWMTLVQEAVNKISARLGFVE